MPVLGSMNADGLAPGIKFCCFYVNEVCALQLPANEGGTMAGVLGIDVQNIATCYQRGWRRGMWLYERGKCGDS